MLFFLLSNLALPANVYCVHPTIGDLNMNVQTPVAENSKQLSPVLSRLMEEVKNDKASVYGSYDRTHNRHNRGQ